MTPDNSAPTQRPAEGARPGALRAAPLAPSWDAGSVGLSHCNVANAACVAGGVLLSFGACPGKEQLGAPLQVQLLHQVTLAPAAAKGLRLMLVKLVAEHESRQAGSGHQAGRQA
jgi:hypothetical protein